MLDRHCFSASWVHCSSNFRKQRPVVKNIHRRLKENRLQLSITIVDYNFNFRRPGPAEIISIWRKKSGMAQAQFVPFPFLNHRYIPILANHSSDVYSV
jgi:hypothetical protein